MTLERPSFKRGQNISLNKVFDFELMKPLGKVLNRKFELPEGVEFLESVDTDFFVGEDYFSEFNRKFAHESLFLRIEEGRVLEKPTILDFGNLEGGHVSHVFVLAGKNSKARIVMRWNSKSKEYCGAEVKVVAEKGSEINMVSVLDFEETHVAHRKYGKCHAGAKLSWTEVVLGGGIVLSEIKNYLEGEGASADVKGLFFSKKDEVFDLNAEAFHLASASKSNILTRGVSMGDSQSVSRGLINIGENVFGCEGYEKHDVLLLGEGAEADAIPQLEILNDDVRCSHGTSIGKVDEESVFYLMSRGLSRGEAEFEILKGYFSLVEEVLLSEELLVEIFEKLAKALS